jgi:hypothetical protein
MTFFHVEEGWLVLSTIEDLCTKEIIAWGGILALPGSWLRPHS